MKITTTIMIMMLLLAFPMIGTSQTLGNSTTSDMAANISLANATFANVNPANNSLVTLQIEGNVRNEMIPGSYIRVDDEGNFEDGLFTGSKINSDLLAYAPATIPTVEKNASVPGELDAIAKPAPSLPDTTAKPVSLGHPRYQDVHSLAGTVPEFLGVGFVGDGTAGAGGMGLG